MEYYIPLEDQPLYLVQTEASPEESDNQQIPRPPTHDSAPFSLVKENQIIVAEKILNDTEDPLTAYLKSCLTMQTLLGSPAICGMEEVLGAISKANQKRRSFLQRCVFFISKDKNADCIIKSRYSIPEDVHLYTFSVTQSGSLFERRPLHGEPSSESDPRFKIECRPNNMPGVTSIPPMFVRNEFCPLSHTVQITKDILKRVSYIGQVKELLDIAEQEIPEYYKLEAKKSLMKHSFVVIEGLDATGKTTLTKGLEEKLNVKRIAQPPLCLQHLRAFFDDLPEIIRRSYYIIGNYITAVYIAEECRSRPVIADRFWYSSAVNAIAIETTTNDLMPEGHGVYTWPSDLLKPDTVLFLTVPENVRRQRIRQRVEAMTEDELSLERNIQLRFRLREAYRRMRDPPCIDVDATGSKDDVAERVYNVLLEQGFH